MGHRPGRRGRDDLPAAQHPGRNAAEPAGPAGVGVVLSEPTPEQRAAIAQYRDEGRIAEYGAEYVEHEKAAGRLPAGCWGVSEGVAMTFGWNENGGCYIEPATGGHIA